MKELEADWKRTQRICRVGGIIFLLEGIFLTFDDVWAINMLTVLAVMVKILGGLALTCGILALTAAEKVTKAKRSEQ